MRMNKVMLMAIMCKFSTNGNMLFISLSVAEYSVKESCGYNKVRLTQKRI